LEVPRNCPKISDKEYFYQLEDFEYAAIATCDADIIKFFGNPKYAITKETAATIVVALDLLLVLIFWLSLICIKPLINFTEEEIVKNALTGPDFTVMLTNPNHNTIIEDIAAIQWQWAENILEKDSSKLLVQGSDKIDPNQDRVVNVHLGLN
jgi:hypothetical protein